MKSLAGRVLLIVVEVIGLAVAAVAALFAFVFWRVQSGPVGLNWAAPAVTYAANAFLFDDGVRSVGAISLDRVDKKGGYSLTLQRVRIGNRGGDARALVPQLDLELYPRDLLSGKIGPRRILVEGSQLRIVRRADRRVGLDFGAASGERRRVFQSLTGGRYFREAFERAELNDTDITFFDAASGRTWLAKNASALLQRTTDGYAARIDAVFDIGGEAAHINASANYNLDARRIETNLSMKNTPVGDLLTVLFKTNDPSLTSLLTGKINVALQEDGRIISSELEISAAPGKLAFGGWSTDLTYFDAKATFDPIENRFDVEGATFASSDASGVIFGAVRLVNNKAGRPEVVAFDLHGKDLTLNPASIFATKLSAPAAEITGEYHTAARMLVLNSVKASIGAAKVEGEFSFLPAAGKSPAITAKAKIRGELDIPHLLEIWPLDLASAARTFVETRISKGVFDGGDFRMDLKPGAVSSDGVMPDDAMSLKFRARGATIHYAPGMEPLVGVAGAGELKGNSFGFSASKASIGGLAVTDGDVDIPILKPKGAPAHFRFKTDGQVRKIIAVLNDPPLAILKQTNLTLEDFSGDASVSVHITRPNQSVAPIETYKYDGAAQFKNVSIKHLYADADLKSANGVLRLMDKSMSVAAKARLAEAPVDIRWTQRFFGTGDRAHFEVEGVAGSLTADSLGIPTRQFINGPVTFKARADGALDALRSIEIETDFQNTTLFSEALSWIKPLGEPTRLIAKFDFEDGETRLSDFSMSGSGIDIAGSARLDANGRLEAANFPVFKLKNAADFSIEAVRDADTLNASLSGSYLNAAELMKSLLNARLNTKSKAKVAATAAIKKVDLRGGASFKNMTASFRQDQTGITDLNFSAHDASGKPFVFALTPVNQDGSDGALFEARSENIGALLAGLFGVTSVRGGEGTLSINYPATSEGNSQTGEGVFEADGIRIVGAPLLAKIFAAGSFTGLSDLVNGDGIELSRSVADFTINGGAITVKSARATGPSVGITTQGRFSLDGDKKVQLTGAVAPAYQINSILGKTPLIGGLLVNREGEGVLAMSYAVDGPVGEPRITVNPLSALAPGVLRRMFEPTTTDAPPIIETPSQ
ncbi:MAG: DUF3971 domain-containing protein [Parvularculaceae bacterium]